MATRWEVERALLKSQLPSLARLLLLTLLSKATASDATIPPEHTPALTEIASMTGMSKSSAAEWLAVLEPAGWVTRSKPEGNSKYDRTHYRMDVGTETAALPTRVSRKAKEKTPSSPLSGPLEGVGGNAERGSREEGTAYPSSPLSGQEPRPSSPLSGTPVVRSADPSSPLSGPTPISEPKKTVKPSAAGAEAPSNKPTIVKPSWAAMDTKPKAAQATPNGAGHTPRQPSLLTPTPRKLPEAIQIVLDALRAFNPSASETDARAVHQAVLAEYGTRVTATYLRTMASNRSFFRFYDAVREARKEEVERAIGRLQATEPECEHGTSAGKALHPTNGLALCPWCRTGTAAPAAAPSERTPPAVVAALQEFRTNFQGRITATLTLRAGQHAMALHLRGLPDDALLHVARAAGANRTTLLAAASKLKELTQ